MGISAASGNIRVGLSGSVRSPRLSHFWADLLAANGEVISVLVADDHKDSLSALATLLHISGYTVHAARTLSEASALASVRRCDLLVGDIQFPDGSGLDLMRDLRARYGLRGIAVSGYTAEQDVAAALRAGFSRHMGKPIQFAELLAAVEELTGSRTTRTSGDDGPPRQDGRAFARVG
jgi:DNA-binding response OmpR family regulator